MKESPSFADVFIQNRDYPPTLDERSTKQYFWQEILQSNNFTLTTPVSCIHFTMPSCHWPWHMRNDFKWKSLSDGSTLWLVSANLAFTFSTFNYFNIMSVLCICEELSCVIKLFTHQGTGTVLCLTGTTPVTRHVCVSLCTLLYCTCTHVHGLHTLMCSPRSNGDSEYTILPTMWLPAAPKPADQGHSWIMQQNVAKQITEVQMWMHDSV